MSKIEQLKGILQKEGNTHTNVVEVESLKGAYYSYLTDSIYISSNNVECTEKDTVVLCHECIHSMQSKRLHIANVVLSNMELVLFVATMACIVFEYFDLCFLLAYILCNVLSIGIRCVLELPAMVGAFDLAKKYASEESIKRIEKAQEKSNKMLMLGVLSFIWPKLFRLALAVALFYFI